MSSGDTPLGSVALLKLHSAEGSFVDSLRDRIGFLGRHRVIYKMLVSQWWGW